MVRHAENSLINFHSIYAVMVINVHGTELHTYTYNYARTTFAAGKFHLTGVNLYFLFIKSIPKVNKCNDKQSDAKR